ncbi:MAG: serine hydrolase domain-containing protein [bacterium]
MNCFDEELKGKLFSALQWSYFGKERVLEGFKGSYSFEESSLISKTTLFDLASLTKVIFTLPLLYYLIHKKEVSPTDKISKFFKEYSNEISILELLSHTSGLPAWAPFYEIIDGTLSLEKRKKEVGNKIFSLKTSNKLKCYSDLNYIVLGFLIEKVLSMPLDEAFEWFKGENGLNFDLTFTPTTQTPLTAFSKVRNLFPSTSVEDENCHFLGGRCGHAGLFGSSSSVAGYFCALLNLKWFEREAKLLSYAGFDFPEGDDSNYGKNVANLSVGHLGFTGTALLINLENREVAVLLTNCTHPKPEKNQRKERIKKCRQLFFDETINKNQ